MPVYSLADFLDLEKMAVVELAHESNQMVYKFKGDDEALNRVRSAANNTQLVLNAGIEAVTDLLLAAEFHCAGELDAHTKTGALWLLKELMQTLRTTNEQAWILERSVATQQA